MSSVAIWAIIVGGMLVTYMSRLSFMVLIPNDWLPRLVKRALRYVPTSILAAIIVPELAIGQSGPSAVNPRLLAGAAAGLIAWRWQNTWATLLVGMSTLWILSSFL